jgi:hypothetical protein
MNEQKYTLLEASTSAGARQRRRPQWTSCFVRGAARLRLGGMLPTYEDDAAAAGATDGIETDLGGAAASPTALARLGGQAGRRTQKVLRY